MPDKTPELATENIGEVKLVQEYATRLREEAAKHGISFINALNQAVGVWIELSDAGVLLTDKEAKILAYRGKMELPITFGPVNSSR